MLFTSSAPALKRLPCPGIAQLSPKSVSKFLTTRWDFFLINPCISRHCFAQWNITKLYQDITQELEFRDAWTSNGWLLFWYLHCDPCKTEHKDGESPFPKWCFCLKFKNFFFKINTLFSRHSQSTQNLPSWSKNCRKKRLIPIYPELFKGFQVEAKSRLLLPA